MESNLTRCGIVVPTLGNRPDYLRECLSSIRKSGDAAICVVGDESNEINQLLREGLIDILVPDSKAGLPAAINKGFHYLPKQIEFINWIGDDDLLASGSLDTLSLILETQTTISMVFGACTYIDRHGKKVWENRSGQWAVPLLRFGPCLIPQPGALFRRDAFNEVGGLSKDYGWAFDLDLFIKLSKLGKLKYIPQTVSFFRWHQDSLTVGKRIHSVQEASRIRVKHLPAALKLFSPLWEIPVRKITMFAGLHVSRSARNQIPR